jgi:hypothetical protein
MGQHSAERRDPGNTDVNEHLTEDLDPADLDDVLARINAGRGVAHTEPGWAGDLIVHPADRRDTAGGGVS